MSCIGKSREKWFAGAAVLICGLVTHGYILTNKISYHDDSVNYFGVGTTFGSGRWALGLIQKFLTKIDFFNYSSSWWNGLLSILLVAVCAMILSELFQIKHTGYAVLVGVLLISFPAMTSLFAYMFTAPYYMFAVLLMISAVYMTVKYSYGFLPAIIMMGFSMGIYQTYFGVATTLFVLILVSDAETRDFIENIKEAFKYLLTLLGGILCYFLGNTICIRNFHVTLLDYQGINDMADVTVKSLIGSVKNAYIGFLQPILGEFCGISNQKAVRILYLAVYLMVGVLVLRRLCKRGMELWNRIYFFVLCCLIPLSISIIYVMAVSDKTVIHTLMIYPYVFGLIYPIVLLEKENLKGKFWKGISVFYCTVAILLSIYYIRLDNIAYLKANYQQETATAYYTEVISQIKSTEKYNSNLPVLFYGAAGSMDDSIPILWRFDDIQLQGYSNNMHDFISYYAGKEFLELHCGYTYQEPENREAIIASENFQKMPCYPCDGSIKIIDGVVVVKWSNFEVR